MNVPSGCVSPDSTVAELASSDPRLIAVFEQLGIDYCCGGRRPLGEAVAEKGLDWEQVRDQIDAARRTPAGDATKASWVDAPLAELAGHIVGHYHERLRRDLSLLTTMGHKVLGVHGERHPELRDVVAVFAGLRAELESHMMKEEHVLFPFIAQIEAGLGHRNPMLGHIEGPISVMEHEHDSAGDALGDLRAITAGYAVPADACTTFRGYYEGLAAFERELHEHIHLENNVLFPRAQEMEARVVGAR